MSITYDLRIVVSFIFALIYASVRTVNHAPCSGLQNAACRKQKIFFPNPGVLSVPLSLSFHSKVPHAVQLLTRLVQQTQHAWSTLSHLCLPSAATAHRTRSNSGATDSRQRASIPAAAPALRLLLKQPPLSPPTGVLRAQHPPGSAPQLPPLAPASSR